MAREIKFRAWLQGKHDSINFGFDGFMDHDVTIQNGQWCSVESGWDIQGQYKSIPLMQLTGLTDKNGKEIYEGDLVASYYGAPVVSIITPVVFEKGCFIVKTPNHTPNQCNLNEFIDYMHEVEVIGNIYENPELLGGE